MESCTSFSNLGSIERGVISSRVVINSFLSRSLIFSLCLLVLGLARYEVLFELIITGSTFKTSKQVLAISILYDGSLAYAG